MGRTPPFFFCEKAASKQLGLKRRTLEVIELFEIELAYIILM
jgi:hypothetical protein